MAWTGKSVFRDFLLNSTLSNYNQLKITCKGKCLVAARKLQDAAEDMNGKRDPGL
jgi:hypothetical protein